MDRMTRNEYSYNIEYGTYKFFKNGEYMTPHKVVNELEIRDLLLNDWIEQYHKVYDEKELLREVIIKDFGVDEDELEVKLERRGKEWRMRSV